MGTLFPDSDEYPDHQPVASPLGELTLPKLKVRVGIPLAAITLSVPGLLPVQPQPQQPDDPPYENQAPVPHRVQALRESTSSDMPFNNFDWPVPQRLSSNAHLMMSSTNAALLFGDAPSTSRD